MDSTSRLDPGTPPPEGFSLDDPEEWEYFTEGANNILYRYTGQHPYFKPFLLRLRKHLPGAPTTRQLHDHLAKKFAPILGDYMMHTDMIELAPDLIPALNEQLKEEAAQDERSDWAGRPIPVKRRRLLDEAETYGLLVEDMSCGNYLYAHDPDEETADVDTSEEWKDMATVEFKPKWLSQSPNAPANWKLCRTCAIRLMNGKRGEEGGDEEYCPLDLASGDKDRIEAAVFAIVNTQNSVMIADPTPGSDDEDEEMADAFAGDDQFTAAAHELAKTLEGSLILLLTRFFRESPIIPLLTSLQSRFGSRGVFTSATLALMSEADPLPSEEDMATMDLGSSEENDIWTAMTMRDCSLFVKIWVRRRKGRGMEARIDCKVGDLDLKTGEGGRAVYWRDVERRLRQGGWYLARGSERDCRAGTGQL